AHFHSASSCGPRSPGQTWCILRPSALRLGLRSQTLAQLGFVLADRRAGVLLFQLLQLRIAGVALGVPLVGKTARLDVVGERTHRRHEIEMVVAAASRQLAVLTGRR